MIAMTLAEVATVVGGVVHGDPALTVTGPAYVDNRVPVPDGLFVAVVGERVDGHDFAGGAHAVLGSRPTEAPTVVVADPVAALARLARHVVDTLGIPVLALTGSQGKTGTKDYLAHVLAAAGPTVATTANNNNEIGVPLTVLRADAGTHYLVVEMGARGIGHIAYLCDIAPPTVAAVINVGTAHIGEFGSREAIAAAKGEIVEALPETGVAVLNADDDLTAAMAGRTRARTLTFGGSGGSGEVSWRGVTLDELGRPGFELGYAGEWLPVTLTQTGAHQVANAAAAAAMALAVGRPLAEVTASLGSAQATSRSRMELHTRADGLLVVNDAYNANPASMRAALDALRALGTHRTGRTIAVLGEMKELGDGAVAAHREVGEAAAAAGVDVVVVVGPAASGIADGVRSGGAGHCELVVSAGRDAALRWVRDNAVADDVVLVKASNGAALEWLAQQLLEGGSTTP
ncbi:UDP-N-acetylmuramoyl-tripeptide--D-alanyl-D-alanine ligase [Nocardioides szechwanensis]|uniref:UDP-N-acetylmuramoyl-tripeptide--D-alanyl-D-alanine ligase n=1 Tax=Nocardioides szechwanensis TaxID=1005944 RepID=A0A1G9VHL5_9ACTN|nr:UDP-N-acetylmuramoyl-tripeptide--D-alanyl-D-alanine ligase [Nocardioides szechwanensis]GEP32923.1 UDP-N-acetylmuramoyl-tripeptide--D-alanyl-D-alanine ligase [Nocardioides szechwanensis]SDM71600.1 UDP-N-acetylmuramoyl-tripeptide--D-alanyl-D-alanine ligase [Nocardioides szechwanensis]